MIAEYCMTLKADDKLLIIVDDTHMQIAKILPVWPIRWGAYPVIANVMHHVTTALASMTVPMEPVGAFVPSHVTLR